METPRKVILFAWLVVAVLGLILIIFTHSKSTSDEATTGQNSSKAIVGKWQTDRETAEYLADGTFVIRRLEGNAEGQTITGKYSFSNPTTLQISLEGASGKSPVTFTDVAVTNTELSMKTPNGAFVSYQRVKNSETAKTKSKPPNNETLKKAILGKWQSSGKNETDEWLDDGTLLIKTNQGSTVTCQYKFLDANHVQVSRAGANAPAWTVAIKGDALNLTVPTEKGEVMASFVRLKSSGEEETKSPTTLTSPSALPSDQPRQISPSPPQIADRQSQKQKTPDLKTAIVGKWQVPGSKEMNEWLDNNTLVVTNDEGAKLNCSYHVTGQNRVLIIPDGSSPMTSPTCVVDVDGDVMTVTRPTEDGPLTEYFVRLNKNGEMPKVSLPVTASSGPAIDPAKLVGPHWKSEGNELVFSPDGTFVFGETRGQWQITGGEIVARGSASHSTIWKLTLAPDEKTLSGYWSAHTNRGGGLTGAVLLTR